MTRWSFLRTWELAEAHERGEGVPVRWRRLREATAGTRDSALVEAAFARGHADRGRPLLRAVR